MTTLTASHQSITPKQRRERTEPAATSPKTTADGREEATVAEGDGRDGTDDEDDLSESLLFDEPPLEKGRRNPRRRGRSSTPGGGGGGRGRDSEDTCGVTSDGSNEEGGYITRRREQRSRSCRKSRRGVSEGPGRGSTCSRRLHPGREEQSRVRAKRCGPNK